MCGIVGLIDFGRRRSVDSNRQIVEAMRDVMAHRGPDGAGLWASDDGRVVLGHRRLGTGRLRAIAVAALAAGYAVATAAARTVVG